jgi:two-component system, NtrC family, sensor kinase
MNHRSPCESDWRWRVFDSLSFPTLILSPDRTIVAANERFLAKVKMPEAMVVGKTCRDMFKDYFYDHGLPCSTDDTCPLETTLEEGSGCSILRQISDPDGTPRWEDRVFSPIKDEQGRVIYVIESIRDVTRTKQLEQMFHGIREFFDRVIQSSASAIVVADRKGRVLLLNPAAEDLFGYHLNTRLELNVTELYPAGDAQKIMAKLREEGYGERGKLPPTRVEILSAGGEVIPVEMTGAIIYEEGRELATMGIYNDLRERLSVEQKLRQAEAQVVQSEKMASLGRLAAGVAHEINNPLTGIVLYGGMLLEKHRDQPELSTSLQCILEDADRCKEIVKNLLAYSRQAGTQRELFTLNSLLEESLGLIRDQKLFMNVTVKWELADASIQILADRNKMRQVIINLVMNAIDAMDKQGVLTLRSYGGPDRNACVEIADSGCGIDPKNLSQIFDPFFTTKAPGRGTGLGLSTAYGIVKDNRGDIQVKQTGPQGTTFLIKLPLADQSVTGMPESIG